MKNGNISDQLKMQERQVNETKVQPANQPNVGTAIQPDISTLQQSDNKQPSVNVPDLGISSVFGLLTPDIDNKEEEQAPMKRKNQNEGLNGKNPFYICETRYIPRLKQQCYTLQVLEDFFLFASQKE